MSRAGSRYARIGLPFCLYALAILALTGCPPETPVQPTASFRAAPTSGAVPLTVFFTDASDAGSGAITAWAWDFGDGTTSTERNPSHTYTAIGTYTASLTVTTSVGDSSATKIITVAAAGPTASFAASPPWGPAPLGIVFTDTSTAGTSAITAWAWDFGDGATGTEQSCSHTYAAEGTYAATLTVTTPDGASLCRRYITVTSPIPPTASFTATPPSGTNPLDVAFTDTSEPGSTPITAWAWDFGDGATSTQRDPAHTYASLGTYAVSLTVTTSIGSSSATIPVTAYTNPTASFTATPSSGRAPSDVTFTDTSTPGSTGIVAWVWTFGDGASSTERSPSHTYSRPGNRNVTLTVTASFGRDRATSMVTLGLPDVWYVSPDGEGDGTAWPRALGSIQQAIDAASAAGGGEVWVAAGTYTAASSADENVVVMAEGVHIYGGFAGMEVVRDSRDWEAHFTIIDGQSERRCVIGANDATLDGFLVKNGYANSGGGVYNVHASPVVSNCSFSANSALSGGGMGNTHASPTITDCTFDGNWANEDGGAIYNYSSSSPTITNCILTANAADSGGGIYNYMWASPTVVGCQFYANTADVGGGMHSGYECTPTIIDCTFAENEASNGAGMFFGGKTSATVTNCTFTDNVGSYGGGVSLDLASPILTNCTFTANSADRGGGMYSGTTSFPVAINCVFAANSAQRGGGVYNSRGYSSSSRRFGPTFINSTFSHNTADDSGGAMHNHSYNCPTVINCVFWGDIALIQGNEIYNYSSSAIPLVTYSCVQGGYSGTGNISDDPLFVDADNGDFSLQSGSPCIDTGTPDVAPDEDILGVARPQGGGYDMGAYEYAGR